MWFWRAPLWRQLATLWLSALVLDALLLWLQFRRPFKFLWIIPYPGWRLVWESIVGIFREYPLLVLGLLAVPLVAILLTIALVANRVAPALLRPSVAR